MANELHCDLELLPQHAAEHRDLAAQWLDWPGGAEAFLAAFRRTHGVVAEPVAQALEALQAVRIQLATDHAEMHHSVGDAIQASFDSFRLTEISNQHKLSAPVQEL